MARRRERAFGRTAVATLIGVAAWLVFLVTGATAQPIVINEFGVLTVNSAPTDIVTGPDGNLWFTQQAANKIGRITAFAQPGVPIGTVTEFVIPTPNSGPTGITVGPDGNLWFTELFANKIGRINPIAQPGVPIGTVTEFVILTPNSGPTDITVGADGRLWFTEALANQIGRMHAIAEPGNPVGTVVEFPIVTPNSGPTGITPGPDGKLWFTEVLANQIGRIHPIAQPGNPVGTVVEFPIFTADSAPFGITAGPDGNLWFTEQSGNKIGRINPTAQPGNPVGTIVEFPIFTPDSLPTGITVGADGNLWFTETDGNNIARINPTAQPGNPVGTITEFPIPTPGSAPLGITSGPDGNLWFAEAIGNQIGRTRIGLGLTVVRDGAGTGSVSSTPAGIQCPSTCAGSFPGGTTVTLNAIPAAGSFFVGWVGGGCLGDGPCTIVLTENVTVTALFDLLLFFDVPAGNFARLHIEALFNAGVTAGCATNPLRYCPDDPVTREQMAVFLLRALEGPGFVPPDCVVPPFTDVPCTNPFARFIQELAARGITSGCGAGNYCPSGTVTRQEMAVFILGTLGVTPPPCTTSPFTDVSCSDPFAPFIVELRNRGVTAGCTPTLYCPTDIVTRAQMAIFLVRAFSLPFP